MNTRTIGVCYDFENFFIFFADVITTSQVFEAILKLCEHIILTETTTAIVVDGGDGADVMVPILCKCYSIIEL